MCAINGALAYGVSATRVDEAVIVRTRDHMASRGPQGAGLWIDERRRIGFGHRRLAIIDLSSEGNQPMSLPDGSLTICFNGEIYNFRDLRHQLEAKGRVFRTESDTEVLLHLYAEYGSEMLGMLRGMFALAIWEARTETLMLARDPFGIKPLYYADDGQILQFASQVKGLLAGGKVDTSPEPAGHAGFFLWGSVPEPYTLHRGIRQLPAGSYLLVKEGKCNTPVVYSSPRSWFEGSAEGTLDLREALLDSLDHHFIADVPVSLFLSAGRDSTTLLALASEIRPEPIRAVTLSFEEYAGRHDDETPLAAEVARQYGAEHHISLLTRSRFDAELERVLNAMDQPSIDGLNTYFVSQAAAEGDHRVALSGLGADELLGGYPSFHQVPKLARSMAMTRLAPGLFGGANRLAARLGVLGSSPKSAALVELGGSIEGAYLLRRGLFLPSEVEEILDRDLARAGLEELATIERLRQITEGLPTVHAKVSALELSMYMRNQLLRDSDWAGMAHSLEIRVPFTDIELMHRVGPWIASGQPPTKVDMANTPKNALPEGIRNRAKTGFTIPIRDWILSGADAKAGGEPYRALARLVYRRLTGGEGLAREAAA
ncbi:MAG: asparagine synthase (glutamine-hydrolyzing) [Methanoregulaceae archaeon]|nr:asparagine synthase (glutamine-hydrolyzing) [Methanoregulaceae archaeon]